MGSLWGRKHPKFGSGFSNFWFFKTKPENSERFFVFFVNFYQNGVPGQLFFRILARFLDFIKLPQKILPGVFFIKIFPRAAFL
jgi:hypothetical protein